MIDFETEIFDACARAAMAEFAGLVVTSCDLNAPASFPALNIVEADNRTDAARVDNAGERAAVVSYDVSTYSSLRTGARRQAKEIMGIVDEKLTSMNFTRSYMSQGPTPKDDSVYRVYARYIAGIDENGKLYRRQ